MSMPRVLAVLTAASVALGSFGLGAAVPAAAAMKEHHHHHALVCKKHWVRLSKDNWIWTCGHHHHHHHMMMKTPTGMMKTPMGGAPKTHNMGDGGGMKY